VSVFKRGNWWWYELIYKGVRIRAGSKSTDRTVAERAEVKKRWELDHPDEACFACVNCGTIQRTSPLSIREAKASQSVFDSKTYTWHA
jgi:hypothetical protein